MTSATSWVHLSLPSQQSGEFQEEESGEGISTTLRADHRQQPQCYVADLTAHDKAK